MCEIPSFSVSWNNNNNNDNILSFRKHVSDCPETVFNMLQLLLRNNRGHASEATYAILILKMFFH